MFAMVPVAHANLLINGSFEDKATPGLTTDGDPAQDSDTLSGNGVGSWETYESLPGWTSPKGVIEIQTANALNPSLGPLSGKNYVEPDSDPDTNVNSTMGQSFIGGSAAEPGTADLEAETAAWRIDGGPVGKLARTSSHLGSGSSAGYANIAVGNRGVTSVIFHATTPSNSDFALAAIEVVPLPAAGLLFGSALAGLARMRRRRTDTAPAGAG